ncbi:hypothetical protein CS8_019560 [Cupriavidus sp. 8B]
MLADRLAIAAVQGVPVAVSHTAGSQVATGASGPGKPRIEIFSSHATPPLNSVLPLTEHSGLAQR